MTVDHRISDPGEKQRLADMGIELGKNKTRLYGLNLSRCLGDHFIKVHDLGFIAVPSVSEVVCLGPQDSGLVVIASDGLWDVAEPGRVMQVSPSSRLALPVSADSVLKPDKKVFDESGYLHTFKGSCSWTAEL